MLILFFSRKSEEFSFILVEIRDLGTMRTSEGLEHVRDSTQCSEQAWFGPAELDFEYQILHFFNIFLIIVLVFLNLNVVRK